MCKHVAAVMYGVGARLDDKPELLFLLRKVDHLELIAGAVDSAPVAGAGKSRGKKTIAAGDLADVFGIEMAEAEIPPMPSPRSRRRRRSLASCLQAGLEEKAHAGSHEESRGSGGCDSQKGQNGSGAAMPHRRPAKKRRHARGSSKQRRDLAGPSHQLPPFHAVQTAAWNSILLQKNLG